MKILNFVLGMVGTNCYLVVNEEEKQCILIDPAVYSGEIAEQIRREGLDLRAILLTHGHFDHIMGIDGFRKEFPEIPVYAHREEEALLKDASMNASLEFGRQYTFSGAAYAEDGDVLDLAGMQFRVIHTPGHTIGGCCYYLQEEKVLFSGDTLFRESIGRTDFPTGNGGQLMRSIREKLFTLPEETAVYPGHMERTTIGDEKKYNPYF
ncbi:MBL fold metallo-hydrolase [Schaedlerella arabinosiphila]|uniref:MBL fold metallo-hydrolase n=1 Tax=Schaedlerella arabinosiphila TaxID=2044587 RepID=A0A9X5H8C0_9FIRM|nr:MBL fold metallo-hydrolase [Schaedlerella arabinosiphila]KAI4444489.1 putative metallo-hydrolase [Schaedlerella arabinosiphila]MCI9632881.1 MBL fold metallo-hydrolase [Ruminococcus sp.]NDO70930.1 MBL fold metallo-hydrolase [Schaedlerella arabinosiphila]